MIIMMLIIGIFIMLGILGIIILDFKRSNDKLEQYNENRDEF